MKARRLLKFGLPVVLAVVFFVAMTGSAFATPSTLPLNVTAFGKTFSVPASLVSSPSVVDTVGVGTWVTNTVAKGIYQKMSPATHTLEPKKKKKLLFFAAKDEHKMSAAQCTLLKNAVVSAIPSASATTTLSTIAFDGWVGVRKEKKTTVRTLLVVQSQHKIYFYVNTKIYTYGCAVGMHAYPTPNGTFHIGKKVKNPTWTNGYAAWSRGMPSFIGPSPNNPLGTRAMYVYTGKGHGGHDTGVRFHGVPPSENSSIGHSLSHGCLRMHRKDVEALFPMVPMDTIVYIVK
jgi:lipoprotein-anchoring transpeptidase ErfK/SrfK